MRNILYIVSLVTLPLFSFKSQGPEAVTRLKYAGNALNLNGSKVIYTESHEEVNENGKHIATNTTYKDGNGKIIAKRVLDFSKSYTQPSFNLEDIRTGYIEGAEVTGNKVKLYTRESYTSSKQEKTLNIPEPYIIDGGFNYFVKQNWDAIIAGKILAFNFVVPARKDYYKFRVRKTKESEQQKRKTVEIYLEPDNFLLRKLIDPIVISYDLTNKRIVSYEGISNIASGQKGQNYVVHLVYPTIGP